MPVNAAKNYTKPGLRAKIVAAVKAGGQGGKPGQWSARKSQIVAQKYKKAGGSYKGAKAAPQKSLTKWTKQEWTTKSGKPSTQGPKATGERYLPKKAIKAMPAKTYAASSKKKREDLAKGKQFSKQPKAAASIAKRHRK